MQDNGEGGANKTRGIEPRARRMRNVYSFNDQNFDDVTRVLNELDVDYFIGNGTLLRLYRDGSLSPNRGDIDICIREGALSPQDAKELLETLGFEVKKSDDNIQGYREPGLKVDFNFLFRERRVFADRSIVEVEILRWSVPQETGFLADLSRFLDKCFRISQGKSTPASSIKKQIVRFLRVLIAPSKNMLHSARVNVDSWRSNIEVEYCYPTDLLETRFEKYADVRWRQPVHTPEVLEAIYGPNWRIPENRTYWHSFAKAVPDRTA
jgi:hypothetical protein